MTRSILKLPMALLALSVVLSVRPAVGQPPVQRFAGIEIGGKSVKCAVVEVPGAAGKSVFEKVLPTNIAANLEPVLGGDGKPILDKSGKPLLKFNADALKRTADAVEEVHNAIRDAFKDKGGARLVGFVASSGVVNLVAPESFAEFEKAILDKKIGDLPALAKLDVESEVRLTFLGIVPLKDRDSTISVDIGSSNTKFGFAVGGRAGEWKTTFGSVSDGMTSAAAQAPKLDGEIDPETARAQVAEFEQHMEKTFLPALQKSLNSKLLDPGRDTVYFTGGIVWAMVSLEEPDSLDRPLVPITPDLLARFAKRVRSSDPFGVKPGDERAEKQARNVKAAKISRANLLAGEQILALVCKEFGCDGQSGGRKAYFSRDGLFAWIKGYAEERSGPRADGTAAPISQELFLEQMRELKELARGRAQEQAAVTQAIRDGFSNVLGEIKKNAKTDGDKDKDKDQDKDKDKDKDKNLRDLADSIKGLQEQIGQMNTRDEAAKGKLISELTRIRELLEKAPPQANRDTLVIVSDRSRDPERAWYCFQRGLQLYQDRSILESYVQFQLASKADPDEPAFWYGLALSEHSLGRTDAARKTARKVASLSSSRPVSQARYHPFFERVQGSDRISVEEYVRSAWEELSMRSLINPSR